MPKTYDNLFDEISCFSRLRRSFYKAAKAKFTRTAIAKFSTKLEQNLLEISEQLKNEQYSFGKYRSFYIAEPKLRLIESACFRDRVVHHSLHRSLEPIFDAQFYDHSYACRSGRGHHKAVLLLQKWMRATPDQYYLKCDIRKFFPSIDREILLQILGKTLVDQKLMRCLNRLIHQAPRSGIPIGNLTSQLFANIYLNELDQFIKRKLRVGKYIRYMDDFIMIFETYELALAAKSQIEEFLAVKLKLTMSPNKVLIGKNQLGVAFLGFVLTPKSVRLRGIFFRRMKKKITIAKNKELLNIRGRNGLSPILNCLNAYLGHIRYCTNYLSLKEELKKHDFGLFKEIGKEI